MRTWAEVPAGWGHCRASRRETDQLISQMAVMMVVMMMTMTALVIPMSVAMIDDEI